MTERIILFDLDGTLIDSAPDVCRALNRTLEAFGRRPHSVSETKGYLGHGARILIEKALAATGTIPPRDVIDQLTKAFLNDYASHPVIDTALFPGVERALSSLRSSGARLGICTNKPSVTTAPVLEIFSLNQYFEAIVCGDQVERQKPSGGHILDTISRVGGNGKSRSLMVGDSENDIHAAIDADVPSIAVTFGYANGTPESLGATALIDRFDDLVETVDKIFEEHGAN